jgi:hypothetical protein
VSFKKSIARDRRSEGAWIDIILLYDYHLSGLFINCLVSLRREFVDGAEFKTRGIRSQIPENLGHVPEFSARLQIRDLER